MISWMLLGYYRSCFLLLHSQESTFPGEELGLLHTDRVMMGFTHWYQWFRFYGKSCKLLVYGEGWVKKNKKTNKTTQTPNNSTDTPSYVVLAVLLESGKQVTGLEKEEMCILRWPSDTLLWQKETKRLYEKQMKTRAWLGWLYNRRRKNGNDNLKLIIMQLRSTLRKQR